MLIRNNTISDGDIVTIKLVGGDEVITKLVNFNDLEIKQPLLVMMAQQGFGLMPYILTADPKTTIHISNNHVITITKTLEEVAKEYIKQTTGLIIA